MSKQLIRLLSLSLLAFSAISVAGQDDFQQPITVDAQSQFVDGKNKISIFRGDVNITQGSLQIIADEVEVDASGGEGKEIFIARGKPAKYSQTLDDGQLVSANAEEIRYQVSVRTLSLNGSANLLRDTSSVSGNKIVYDMTREQLSAESTGDSNNRVTTIFRPESLKQNDDNSGGKDNEQNKP